MKKNTEIIYVKILDEDVDVWRPVMAEKSDEIYTLIGIPQNESIKGESLEFEIGSNVHCEEKTLDGKIEKVAIRKI